MKKLLPILLLLLASVQASAQHVPVLSVLGDSYSTYEGYLTPDTNAVWYNRVETDNQRTDVRDVRETWWWQVVEQGGFRLDTNNSFSGSTICNTGYGKADYSDRSFISRADNLGAPDVILVLGATNDSWCGAPIGQYKYADYTARDLKSFRPAMAKLLQDLRRMYPHARLLFILNSQLKRAINESVEFLCQKYGVQLVKLHDIDKLSGHPSVSGMQAIARQVLEALMEAEE